MSIQDFLKVIRTRWIGIAAVTLIACSMAVVYTLVSTPLYQASTRLFVSTTTGTTLSEAYQGNRFSQERVGSYVELLTGRTLAQRTVDKLELDMSAAELESRVSASTKLDTVLINVDVVDESPVLARDIANTLSDEFVLLVRELETPENGDTPDARVVVEQRASIPTSPVSPKTTRDVAIGTLLGIAVGIGLAVLRDILDNTVKSRKSLEDITGVGVVGTIPLDKARHKNAAISFDTDRSSISEAFRKLRTNLQFLAVDQPPRIIVLTSSLPHEGKSTTAINIALALAESEHNVALVDGDMRRPMLHKYLGLVGTVGFSDVLSGRVTIDDALQKTRFPGLTVLASGALPPNPSELLGTQSAKKVLAELRGRFDYVIVDSTPLLAVTDAAILAANTDGTLIMARYGETREDQLSHAVANLEDVGATLLGAVLTMVPNRGVTSYAYAYGQGYYGSDSTQHARRPAPTDESSATAAEDR